MTTARAAPCATRRRARGAVLVMALILLAVLTLLGVTAMHTTSLEQKMATNTQEGLRAFQLAEAGLSTAAGTGAAYNLAGLTQRTLTVDRSGSAVGQARYRSEFNGWSAPPAGSLYSASQFRAAHFNFDSTGEPMAGGATTGITATVRGGAYQIAPLP